MSKVSASGITRYLGPEAEEKGGVFTRYPHMDAMIEGTTVSFLHRDHQASVKLVTTMVIPPFLTGHIGRFHAAIFSFCAGVMPPMPILGRSLL